MDKPGQTYYFSVLQKIMKRKVMVHRNIFSHVFCRRCSSTINNSKDASISCSVMESEDVKATAKIVAESFCQQIDPAIHLKIKPDEMHDYSISLCEKVVGEELSMVAKASDGKIVACFVAHDFNSNLHVNSIKPPSKNNTILLDFLSTLDKKAFTILHNQAGFEVKKCTNGRFLSSQQSSSFVNQGILTTLMTNVHDHHRKKGYEYIYHQCLSPATVSLFQQSLSAVYETKPLYTLSYQEYAHFDNLNPKRSPIYPWKGLSGSATAMLLKSKTVEESFLSKYVVSPAVHFGDLFLWF